MTISILPQPHYYYSELCKDREWLGYIQQVTARYFDISTVVLWTYITTCHFRWPCAIFADTGVFKIRITILKSMQFVAFLWDFSQILSNHQSNTKNNISKYEFCKYEIYQVPWNSMELQKKFHGIPWNFWGENYKFRGIPLNSMELWSMEKVPWNSMELWIWRKFHGIPWNHRCCSNVVQKVPWNSGESSMELFDQKVSICIEKRFWVIFCYVMSNAGNAYKV